MDETKNMKTTLWLTLQLLLLWLAPPIHLWGTVQIALDKSAGILIRIVMTTILTPLGLLLFWLALALIPLLRDQITTSFKVNHNVKSMETSHFLSAKNKMTAIPITISSAISGQRTPAITATMMDGSQPRPTPSRKPYVAMQ
ncbi:MAG: hypothetical protein HOO95_09345 [Gallionella sp.]|nr:hypothetical protein [Gallionella sp.]